MRHTVAGTGFEGRAAIIRANCRKGIAVRLVREPDNPHDPNAVAVLLPVPKVLGLFGESWKKIGYIKASRNKKVARALERGDNVRAVVTSYFAPPHWETPRVSIDIFYEQ